MNVFSPTLGCLINTRPESYHFLTDTPKKIGDTARIFVDGVGERHVLLCEAPDTVYCLTWLVETARLSECAKNCS